MYADICTYGKHTIQNSASYWDENKFVFVKTTSILFSINTVFSLTVLYGKLRVPTGIIFIFDNKFYYFSSNTYKRCYDKYFLLTHIFAFHR